MRPHHYHRWLLLLALLLTGAPLSAQYPDVVWMQWPRESAVFRVDFTPDSRYLALAAFDGTVQVRDVAAGNLLWSEQQYNSGYEIAGLAFSSDGALLAYALAPAIKVWDVNSGDLVKSIEYLDQGHRVLSGSLRLANTAIDAEFTPQIVTHQLPGGDSIAALRTGYVTISTMGMSPAGDRVAIAITGGYLIMFNALTGDSLYKVQAHAGAIQSIAFSHDGRYFATGGNDRVVKVWDVATGSIVRRMLGHRDIVNALDFSSDGKYLVSASGDGTFRVWNIESGENVHTYDAFPGYYSSVAFSPDMRYILTGSFEGTLILWSARYTSTSGVEHPRAEGAGGLTLTGATPNPFRSTASIGFRLASSGRVTLEVFDLYGERVATLADAMMDAGEHAVRWNAVGVPAGLYHYRVTAGGEIVSGRMVRVR